MDEAKGDRLAHFIVKKMNRAIYEFGMIEDRDHIAVALSGGKDSLSLLRLLQYRQRFSPESYTLCAVHVVGDARGRQVPPHPELALWLDGVGIEYRILPTWIADDEQIPVPCDRCARNRRRTLFEAAGEMGCNKIAFGHHMDDLAETVLLNLIHQGKPESIRPVRDYFGGKYTVIRPLCYTPEREIVRYACTQDFPPPPSECPHGEHTQCRRMKEAIQEFTKDDRKVRENLVRAGLRSLAEGI